MTEHKRNLILVGGGHAHVHVVRALGLRPEPGVVVTLVARDLATPYSGMLPGHVAGLYSREECHIDVAALARRWGVRLLHAEMAGLDPERRLVLCRGGAALPYDVLSLDVGSSPELDVPGAREHAIGVKPVEPFLARWREIAETPGVPQRIAVVGGGAGGVETALAMAAKLGDQAALTLVTRDRLLPLFNPRARRLLAEALRRRGVRVVEHASVARVEPGALVIEAGGRVEADRVFWATWAGAPAWLPETGLALDGRGFVAVDACLRSVSHPEVFAAGDVAAVLPHPREKAGVFAVRQGPPLAQNLRRTLRGLDPIPFTPQRTALALIGTGGREAVAVRGSLTLQGAWVWRLKEFVDRRWIGRYQEG